MFALVALLAIEVTMFVQSFTSGDVIYDQSLQPNQASEAVLQLQEVERLQIILSLDMRCRDYESEDDDFEPLYSLPFSILLTDGSGAVVYEADRTLSENTIRTKIFSSRQFSSRAGFSSVRFSTPIHTIDPNQLEELNLQVLITDDLRYRTTLNEARVYVRTNYPSYSVYRFIGVSFLVAFGIILLTGFSWWRLRKFQ